MGGPWIWFRKTEASSTNPKNIWYSGLVYDSRTNSETKNYYSNEAVIA